jgi:hypothetical protein
MKRYIRRIRDNFKYNLAVAMVLAAIALILQWLGII